MKFKTNKQLALLDLIIKEYVKSKEPIGSESLKVQFDFGISSATIRNYCKALEKQGYISQLYVSSGRVPTMMSLKNYWNENLKYLQDDEIIIDSSKLERCSNIYEIYCIANMQDDNVLNSISVFNDKYILLHFSRGEVIIEYSRAIYRFISNLVGSEINAIFTLAKNVCANDLAKKILALKYAQDGLYIFRFGCEFLTDLMHGNGQMVIDLLNANNLLSNKNGIYFEEFLPKNYMGIICDISYNDQRAKMLCVGNIVNDYENFFNDIRKIS